MSSTSTSTSGSSPDKLTIDIRPLLEDVSQVMTKHITSILSGVVGEYTVYKETHETIMGLPCVRKLQERISDLENQLNGGGPASEFAASPPPTEISELQSAIVDLNRYIQVLETRMDVKNVVSEEAIRLEVQENDDESSDANEPDVIIPPSVHTNRIIDSSVVSYDETEETEDAEETAEEEETAEDTAEETDDAEETAEEEETEDAEDAEETAEDAEETEATTEEEETAEGTAEETEDTEETAEDAEDAEETEETTEDAEEEIEVSEIKIKGVTYFTTSAQNGIIYACVDDDVGDEVGVFKNGVALFKSKTAKK